MIIVTVAFVIFVPLMVVLLLLLIALAKCGLFNCASTPKLSKQLSISQYLKDTSINPPALEVIVHSSSSQESGKLLGSSGQETHMSTPTSVESTTPLFRDHSGSSQGIAIIMISMSTSMCINQCQYIYMYIVLKF